jgi:HEPN domain-containing protein
MGIPSERSARRFYRAAAMRWEDAQFLLESERTTAAVYLAGYCVECVLKALILSQAPAGEREAVLDTFRGATAHKYDWLRFLYKEHGGPPLPKEITEAFRIVEDWGTELRYQPGTIPVDDAEAFLTAVRRIWDWADGRLS